MKSLKHTIQTLAACSLTGFAICLILYQYLPSDILLAVLITFGTTAYHFTMRIMVGHYIDSFFHNSINHKLWWFKEKRFEKQLYRFLRVRFWKGKLPSYNPEDFAMEARSLNQLIGATCQAELVHEVIVLLSFVPLLFSVYFDAFYVFLITSFASAVLDSIFVILQRYNRPRLIKLLNRKKDNS